MITWVTPKFYFLASLLCGVSRYGGYLVFHLAVPPDQEGAARHFVTSTLCKDATLTYHLGGSLSYELPSDQIELSR